MLVRGLWIVAEPKRGGLKKKQSMRSSWNNLLEVGEGSLDIVLVVKTEAPGVIIESLA